MDYKYIANVNAIQVTNDRLDKQEIPDWVHSLFNHERLRYITSTKTSSNILNILEFRDEYDNIITIEPWSYIVQIEFSKKIIIMNDILFHQLFKDE